MRFVVYGAGAVGGVLGGRLALSKNDVLLICREPHARAINENNGLKMKSARGEYSATLRAASDLAAGEVDDDTCILFTPKSHDTKLCVEKLSKLAPAGVSLVSFQNGVSNEEIISEKFTNVHGGVCRMTCSALQPGQVSFRRMGRLVIGKYPKGSHSFPKKLAPILESAGFEVSVSNSIMCDKWLKLVVNLQSGFNAIVDSRDHDSVEFMDLKVGVLEEAKKVLKSEKMRAKSCDDRDLSVDDVIKELKKPKAPRSPSAVRVNNSTWQNLYLKRKEVENGYFHGPIIEIAKKHKIPVPFNEVALELVTECCKSKLGPGVFRAGEVLEKINLRGKDR
ncbi:MAG: 2-dehydropantoate 2-reductase [Candidatus Latescibacterota bacterium]|nr:MAG: 2-dehydropantoate 2-reductase [Candidatus Latescibacterota bacterium]